MDRFLRSCGTVARWAPRLIVLALAVWQITAVGLAQQPAVSTVPAGPSLEAPELNAETVTSRLEQVESDASLDEEERTALVDVYQQALADLEVANKAAADARRFSELIATAPERMARLRQELEREQPEASVPANATLDDLAELEAAQTNFETWKAEPQRRLDRQTELTREIGRRTAELDDLASQLATDPPGMTLPETVARRTRLEAQVLRKQNGLERDRLEQRYLEATRDMVPLERESASRRLNHLEDQVAYLRIAIAERRRAEADQQVREARQLVDESSPLHELATENAELVERRVGEQGLVAQIERTRRQIVTLSSQLSRLRTEFESVQSDVEAIGLTNTAGAMLRRNRAQLPDQDLLEREIRLREQAIIDARVELLQLGEQRQPLDDLDEATENLVMQLELVEPLPDGFDLEEEARKLLETRREYLDQVISDYNVYFSSLAELNNVEYELANLVEEYANYIDERVLWIRSTSLLAPRDFRHIGTMTQWLMNAKAWDEAYQTILRAGIPELGIVGLALLAFLPLWLWGRRLRARIHELGEKAAKRTADRIGDTVRAGVLTLFVAATYPALLWIVARQIQGLWEAIDVSSAVMVGIQAVALQYFPLELLRQICRNKGLGESHFGWPSRGVKRLRRALRWTLLALLPCVFIVATVEAQQRNELWQSSLGRGAFIVAMGVVALFAHQLLRPKKGIVQEWIALNPQGPLARLHVVWYIVGLIIPVSLIVLAAAGWYYTSLELASRVQASVWFLFCLALASAFIRRWLLLARRKLAIQQARERIAQAMQAAQQEESVGSAEAPVMTIEESLPDLYALNEQSARLMRAFLLTIAVVGLWSIWVDVLPALGLLRSVTVWNTMAEVVEPVTLADGTVTERTERREAPITLAHVLFALIVAVLTIVASKNIPGFIEITTLQRLPLEPSVRFAITTLARYAITITGILLTFSAIGIGWSQVQWLAAAVTVGLGFGLQEIFANFVSGLIILFERPIRVGDVVTVGDVSGTVSRIRTRATTITDWDYKETIIPNRELITGRVMNWTLTDPVTRIMINVGVAYGSDTELALRLMLQAAQEHSNVLETPPPFATFELFGASSLDLVLRAYVPSLDKRLPTITELHQRIDREFKAAGIEIAFPQQDVHVRSIEDGLMLRRAPRQSNDEANDG